MAVPTQAQTSLNVTNFGAWGDAVQFFVNTTSNSAVVMTTNQLSSADVGKAMELFGAGPYTTPTNNQDLVAIISNVSNGTNITLDRVAGATTNGCTAVYGHNNATNFQNCINAAPSNSVINIPNGTYLIIGASNFAAGFTMTSEYETHPSITISKGGLTLLGQSESGTILLGCGAWQNKSGPGGPYAYRGYMFDCQGPVTNNGPLIFDSLTINGGAIPGMSAHPGAWPTTQNGDGWDATHDAMLDTGSAPYFEKRIFRNCHICCWRGEQLKGTTSATWDSSTPPETLITNCVISDGDADALNLNFSHVSENCTFSNLDQCEEFYQAYATNASAMQNCTITNMIGAIMAFDGAFTNAVNPTYNFQSNVIYLGGINGIQTCPVNNLFVEGNTFIGNGSGTAIAIGINGYIGSSVNSNIVVAFNVFTNIYTCIGFEGVSPNSAYNVSFLSNSFLATRTIGGSYGWQTNVVFAYNIATAANGNGTIDVTGTPGQWFLDELSDQFPFWPATGTPNGTNVLSYEHGARQQTWSQFTTSTFQLDDSSPGQIPPGAQMLVSNETTSATETLYSSSTMQGPSRSLPSGQTATYTWRGTYWDDLSQPRARVHF
jgi:hypothetical protein